MTEGSTKVNAKEKFLNDISNTKFQSLIRELNHEWKIVGK